MRARFVALAALVVVAVVSVAATATASSAVKSRTFKVRMTGGAETPVGDRGGAGTVKVTVKSTGSVCWTFSIRRIDGAPTAAHIHKGKARSAGAVVVPFGTKYAKSGCTKTSAATAAAILSSPKGFYVNVHNAKHPAGALRSQL